MLLALRLRRCVCALVVSSQKCAAVNRLSNITTTAGSEHKQWHTTQSAATRHALPPFFLMFVCVCTSTYCMHVSAHISKGKKKRNICNQRCRGCGDDRGGAPWELPCFGLGASSCPLRAPEALALHSFFPDTNQTQQHKHIQGLGGSGGCSVWSGHQEGQRKRQRC